MSAQTSERRYHGRADEVPAGFCWDEMVVPRLEDVARLVGALADDVAPALVDAEEAAVPVPAAFVARRSTTSGAALAAVPQELVAVADSRLAPTVSGTPAS